MRRNERAFPAIVQFNTDGSFIDPEAGEDCVVVVRAESHEASGVRQGVHLILQVQVRKTVDINFGRQHDDNPVPTELDGFDFTAEAQFADASVLVIIPYHDFVGGEAGIAATANEGKKVGPEEHFDNADSTVGEYTAKGLAVRFDVVDAAWCEGWIG